MSRRSTNRRDACRLHRAPSGDGSDSAPEQQGKQPRNGSLERLCDGLVRRAVVAHPTLPPTSTRPDRPGHLGHRVLAALSPDDSVLGDARSAPPGARTSQALVHVPTKRRVGAVPPWHIPAPSGDRPCEGHRTFIRRRPRRQPACPHAVQPMTPVVVGQPPLAIHLELGVNDERGYVSSDVVPSMPSCARTGSMPSTPPGAPGGESSP